jgi:hypothetical protein
MLTASARGSGRHGASTLSYIRRDTRLRILFTWARCSRIVTARAHHPVSLTSGHKWTGERNVSRSRPDFQKAARRDRFESSKPLMQSRANHRVGCMPDFCSSRANGLWCPDSAESPQICATFQTDILRRHFLSSSPLSPANQSSLCGLGLAHKNLCDILAG